MRACGGSKSGECMRFQELFLAFAGFLMVSLTHQAEANDKMPCRKKKGWKPNMKKLLALVLALVMCMGLGVRVCQR